MRRTFLDEAVEAQWITLHEGLRFRRGYPVAVMLCLAVTVLVAVIFAQATASEHNDHIKAESEFMKRCLVHSPEATCQFVWSDVVGLNWMTQYKAYFPKRAKQFQDRLEPTEDWPAAGKEWLPKAVAPPQMGGQ